MSEATETMEAAVEKRSFQVAPDILMHLINSQAGSCGKAIIEGVMNSIDAGASQVTIDIDRKGLRIVDNGCGFPTREAILATFEVFGFDHSGLKRDYGRFGLGRGQLWKYARSSWLTHGFKMDVDIPAHGLDYSLTENLPHVDGLVIEATFYEQLTAVELVTLEREVTEMCRFAIIPVVLNGKTISTHPSTVKWSTETPEAYLKSNDSSGLKVYNQGIFVCELSKYQIGVGGIICTKPGQNLDLNMARNDVERSSPLWKKLVSLCKSTADKAIKKPGRGRLNDDERRYLAGQVADPSYTIQNLMQPVFTLCDGRHMDVLKLYRHFHSLSYKNMAITVAEEGSRIGERIQRERSAVVLTSKTLARFGVESIDALLVRIKEYLALAEPVQMKDAETNQPITATSIVPMVDRLRRHVVEDITQLPSYKAIESSAIPDKELSKQMRLYLNAIRATNWYALNAVRSYMQDWGLNERKIVAADSDNAEAYTDGATFIAVTRKTMDKAMKEGHHGLLRSAQLLIHEYLHNENSLGTHVHDIEFYNHFHDIVLDCAKSMNDGVLTIYLKYAKELEKVPITTAKEVDKIERLELPELAEA